MPNMTARRSGGIRRWMVVIGVVATIPFLWLIVATVDGASLVRAWQSVSERPLAVAGVTVAFGAAFVVRAIAWQRVLPDLSLGQALAALHVSLGANHILPFRMGEPLRVVSVVRRTGIDWQSATASTVTLRAGDVVAIGLLGLVAGMGQLADQILLWLLLAAAAVAVAFGATWLRRLRARGVLASLPGPAVIAATLGAWVLESAVVWQAGGWVGLSLTPSEAMATTAAAVLAQVVAVAPGGLGTYEAGGTAALVVSGHDPGTALAVILTAHAVKTAYSLVMGAIATIWPAPSFFGRLRLPSLPELPPPVIPEDGPVVLFMPAHNEEASVGQVVARVPAEVCGRQVHCLVVDDGSTDRTAEIAREAGATVIGMGHNQGLGAAVRLGLREALKLDPSAIAFCDADGEYAPEELADLVAPILKGEADYVVGSRFSGDIQRMLPHRRLGNLVLTAALSWVARRRVTDGQSGYRAFSGRAADTAEIIHDFNYAQVLTLDLLAKGMTYQEVPISYAFRTTGRSFVRLGRYLRAVVPAVYREVNAAS